MAVDLHIAAKDITFPSSIELHGVSSFDIQIYNIGDVGVSSEFVITLTLSPLANINQRFKYEYLWPASAGLSPSAGTNKETFYFSPNYNYFADPLFGIAGEVSTGIYNYSVEVNIDAEGQRYIEESFYLNNSVSAGVLEIVPTTTSGGEPGFNSCNNITEPDTGYNDGFDEGENFCAITFSGNNGLYWSDFEVETTLRERQKETPPMGFGEGNSGGQSSNSSGGGTNVSIPNLGEVSIPVPGAGVGRTWTITPTLVPPPSTPTLPPTSVTGEVTLPEFGEPNVPPYSFTD